MWLFWAAADIIKASEPAVTPVICHVTVVVPAPRVPTINVGLLTVNRPFWEVSVAVTPDRVVYVGATTLFCRVMETVAVSPMLMVGGIVLLLSTISKTCDRAVP